MNSLAVSQYLRLFLSLSLLVLGLAWAAQANAHPGHPLPSADIQVAEASPDATAHDDTADMCCNATAACLSCLAWISVAEIELPSTRSEGRFLQKSASRSLLTGLDPPPPRHPV